MRKKRKRLKRFINADEDESDLKSLADDIGRAIERFQVLLLRHIREHQLVCVYSGENATVISHQ